MDLKKFNLILAVICILLVLNLFFDFKDLTGSIVYENLKCEINGNDVFDANLCCYEIQKFSKCEDGRCSSKNYDILFNKDLEKYCKKEGYNVRL